MVDRIVLIGDTAHSVHPIAGQGLNLGFRDVAALTEVIFDAASLGLDIGSSIILDRYQRWRRLDNTVSTATFDALNAIFSSDNLALRAVRSAGLNLVDRLPELKRYLISEAAGIAGEVPKLMRGEKL